ncbi:unnamed protein product [Choristocarpus tenellus]
MLNLALTVRKPILGRVTLMRCLTSNPAETYKRSKAYRYVALKDCALVYSRYHTPQNILYSPDVENLFSIAILWLFVSLRSTSPSLRRAGTDEEYGVSVFSSSTGRGGGDERPGARGPPLLVGWGTGALPNNSNQQQGCQGPIHPTPHIHHTSDQEPNIYGPPSTAHPAARVFLQPNSSHFPNHPPPPRPPHHSYPTYAPGPFYPPPYPGPVESSNLYAQGRPSGGSAGGKGGPRRDYNDAPGNLWALGPEGARGRGGGRRGGRGGEAGARIWVGRGMGSGRSGRWGGERQIVRDQGQGFGPRGWGRGRGGGEGMGRGMGLGNEGFYKASFVEDPWQPLIERLCKQ